MQKKTTLLDVLFQQSYKEILRLFICFIFIFYFLQFNEVLELHCPRNTLSIRLKGRGVTPAISLSIPDGELDLGDALVNDSVISTFKV